MPTPYSHLIQPLLNNLDSSDIRVRTYPYTIDAQLYNLAATAAEDLGLRYYREVAARFVETCPVCLDNGGVYTSAQLPNTFVPPDDGSNPPLNVVQGSRNGQWITLSPYDDRLPVPTRVTIDTNRQIVAFSSPKIFDWVADGIEQYTLTPNLTLPVPTKLSLWLEGLLVDGRIDILITGIAYPTSAWQKNRKVTSETVSYTVAEGLAITRTVWGSIQSIVIRNAPVGVRLACWHLPFDLPATLDTQRPYTSPQQRDVTFDRYWQHDGTWINERFHGGPSVGLSTLTCYATPELLQDLEIDPRAYTMMAISGTKIYTIDRRNVFPSRLEVTAITSDPLYSINVVFDETQKSTTARYVRVQTLQHASNLTVQSFRYIVEDPNKGVYCIDSTGKAITYSGGAGWSLGSPTDVSFPLTLNGTYVITLECIGSDGNLSVDRFPYLNAELNILSAIDMSTMVPAMKGIARDSLERLWIWTGDFAIPIQVHYDAYLFDIDSNTVYLTDPFDQVSVA